MRVARAATRLGWSPVRHASTIWSRHARDEWTNVPARLENEWYDRRLLTLADHPLARVWRRASTYFGTDFECRLMDDPVVSVADNFDSLLIPQDHVSRSRNDTYVAPLVSRCRRRC